METKFATMFATTQRNMKEQININEIIKIAKAAGDEILKIYAKDFEVYNKADESPLTEADKNANAIIIEGLQKLYPNIPYISEEVKQTDYAERKQWNSCWLIDPLDGTKEFVKKNGEFTVNIALIENGEPVLGVVYIPVEDTYFYAIKNEGTYKKIGKDKAQKLPQRSQVEDKKNLKVVASRSHLSEEVLQFVEELKAEGKNVEFISAGSSLKFCLVAEGKADIYPRLAPTMEWDTAAAHILCTEVGLQVQIYESKKPLAYNKENLLNPWFVVR